MKIIRFTILQLRRYLLRPRSLLVLPVFAFIAYRSVNGISVLAVSYGTSANIWDAFFYALGNSDTVYAVLTLLFLYLLGDPVEETRFGQTAMLHLGSRSAWWAGKLLTLLGACLAYTGGLLLVLVIWAAVRLPFQAGWSNIVLANHTIEIGLPYDATETTPLMLLIKYVSLLFLGWMGLALLGMFTSLMLRRRFVGALAGIGALLVGYLGLTYVHEPGNFLNSLLISYHMEYAPGWMATRMIPYRLSLAYWGIWMFVFGLAGLAISKAQDDPGMRL